MTPVPDRLKQYTQWRGDGIAEAEAQRVVIATLERLRRSPSARRHWRNVASALAAALLVTGGLVLLQLRQPSHVPQPAAEMPDDSVTLSSYLGLQTFRLRNRTLSAPEGAWRVANRAQLDISNRTDCSTAVIRVIDPVTRVDLRDSVELPGCFDRIGRQTLVLQDGTVLLYHYQVLPAGARQSAGSAGPLTSVAPLGGVRFDWQAGRIIQTYPGLSVDDGVVLAPDGRTLYVAQPIIIRTTSCGEPPCGVPVRDTLRDTVSVLDLGTGQSQVLFAAAERDALVATAAGLLAVSSDRRSLFLNEPQALYIFDLGGRGQPQIVSLVGDQVSATAAGGGLRWILPLVFAESKEIGGPSIAADPSGHWVARLAVTDPGEPTHAMGGVWLVNTEGTPRVIGRFHRSDEFRAIAASSDGRVVYLLEESGRGRYLLLLDAQNGRDLGEILLCTSTACQGFDGITDVTPADQ